jgi:hypothetical protein
MRNLKIKRKTADEHNRILEIIKKRNFIEDSENELIKYFLGNPSYNVRKEYSFEVDYRNKYVNKRNLETYKIFDSVCGDGKRILNKPQKIDINDY